MKKISKAIYLLVLMMVMVLPNKSFAQISRDGLFECDKYPTADVTLNSSISDLVAQNEGFERRMSSIYGNLSLAEQQQVNSYINNGDETLFSSFPQFNDEELKNIVSLIRNKYSVVLNKHKELFPQLEANQRSETIKAIIQCASSKARVEREGTLNARAIDPCEIERRNCIVSVAGQAAGMHVACAWADLTVIAGIICHAAAFAYQYSAGNNCNIAARRCVANQQ